MKNKICVYAICKNELSHVDSWLENMSEADYICVLDTGSTDGTFEKLKGDKRVTKVVQKEIKPWRFDVARNESMKLCPKDANILVCTDFDELFNEGWAELVRLNWSENTTRMFYQYAWSHSPSGEPTDIFMYDKIHTRDYHWIFPVHEVLDTIDPEFNQIAVNLEDNVFLEHYQDKSKDRKYYFELLELAVKENPDSCHEKMLLAREYLVSGQYKEALRTYLETLKMPEIDEPNYKLVLLESLGRCADLYKEEKNYDECIWYCTEFIKEDPTYREPYFILSGAYSDMKLFTLAETMAEAGFKYGVRKYDWVERATPWTYLGYELLGRAHCGLNKYEEAMKDFDRALEHEPDNAILLKNFKACYDLATKTKEEDK